MNSARPDKASRFGPLTPRDIDESNVYRKVTTRILPFLFLGYLVAYLNRVNIGFARESMSSDLGFSDTAYGLGAGIFFIGYFIFEVPSNLMMHKIGVRKTLQRIMILWGVTSSTMMFVNSEWMFYVLRFFLGVFEAGFAPAIVLYFTYWYPAHRRGRIMAILLTAVAISGLIGAPVSGAILSFANGVAGIAGWQWMFLLEGVPAVVLGLLVFRVLSDSPATAKWLSEGERVTIQNALDTDSDSAAERHASFRSALRDYRVYALCFVYFSISAGAYLISFWLPTIIKRLGSFTSFELGFVIAIPYLVAAVSMVVVAAHSDRTGERRWHLAISGAVGVFALIMSTQVASLVVAVALFSVATAALLSMMPIFWTLPAKFLTGAAAAGGIALINSVGNLSGFVSPFMAGYISDLTGSLHGSLWAIAATLLAGCVVIVLVVRKDERLTEGEKPKSGVSAR